MKMGHGVVLICSYMEDNLPESYQEIVNHVYDILINTGFQPTSFYIGICDELMTLERLNESVVKAKNANVVSQFMECNNIAYSRIGVYKYIMSIVNNPILYHEVEDSIFVLQKYDASHDVNLLETVISYIKNNGDYAKTSEELFQHSNTVRYRIRKAEQLLNLPENTANEEMAIVIRSYLLHNLIMQ